MDIMKEIINFDETKLLYELRDKYNIKNYFIDSTNGNVVFVGMTNKTKVIPSHIWQGVLKRNAVNEVLTIISLEINGDLK